MPVERQAASHSPTSCRPRACAQALERGAPALLWRRALDGLAEPTAGGAGARDRLAHAVSMALGDLFAFRAGDEMFVAAQHVALHRQAPAWYSAMVHASRPLRVATAAQYCMSRCLSSAGACLGVRPPPCPRCRPRARPKRPH